MANDDFDLPRPTDEVPSATSAVINDDAKVLDYVINSTGTVTTRTGKQIMTIDQAIQGAAPVPLNGGVWASGQIFEFYNQYMYYDGLAYAPLPATTLPYTVGATPDLGFVYQVKLNSLQALSGLSEPSGLDSVYTRRFQSVANMIGFDGHSLGLYYFVSSDDSIITYQVVDSADDIELGGGLWAKKIDEIVTGNDGDKYKIISGVIRNAGAGWEYIDDSGHNPVGFTSIVTNLDGTITLNHPVGASQVVSLLAAPDETYAQYGLLTGASVAQSFSVLTLTAPLSFSVNMDTQTVVAPAHFGDKITATLDSAFVKVEYQGLLTGQALSTSKSGSDASQDLDMSPVFSSGRADCYFKSRLHGYVSYDGVNWSVTGSNAASSVTPSWTGSALTLTHPSASGIDVSVCGRYPMHAMPNAVGATSIDVNFVDLTGVTQSSENTNLRAFFNRGDVNCINSGSIDISIGTWVFNGPVVKVDANDLVSAGGNIWLIGLMKT